jgi:prepilin-type N-terminal cleavage/methylation domain-containing protein
MSRRRRAAFTLVELMIAMTIVGLLARFAIPKVSQFRLRARAAHIVADMEVIRGAAFQVVADSGVWPVEAGLGTIPPVMIPYLPPNFSYTPEPGVTYDWRLTGMPGGDPTQATAGTTMGMGVQATDDELRVEVERSLGSQTTLVAGGVVYWLIWGPTIRP